MSNRGNGSRADGAMMEILESRRLLSAAALSPTMPGDQEALQLTLPPPATVTPVPSSDLAGTTITALATEHFRAVVGMIGIPVTAPTGYVLEVSINWGDGTASPGRLAKEANGAEAVIGQHTYAKAGTDAITVTLADVPSTGNPLAALRVGTFNSTANVITSSGGLTLSEHAASSFTAELGTFQSSMSLTPLEAIINWGDGQESVGSIVTVTAATSSTSGTYEVMGTHLYTEPGSYVARLQVLGAFTPSFGTVFLPVTPTVEIANIVSVIDVLPALAAT